jgi:uncharacterized protein (TIGR03790 family)
MFRRLSTVGLFTGLLLLAGNKHAAAQSGANVLVVVNDASETSRTIAEYYARKRAVPAINICHITTSTEDTIERVDFDRQIQGPTARCIAAMSGQDRILYIVLTKGVPIRIQGTSSGREATVASVDSELTLLYRRQLGLNSPIAGPLPNPYFAGNQPASGLPKPFTHERADVFLVTRLDGFTVDDVIGLIDRSLASQKDGRILLDGRASWQASGNTWLKTAADILKSVGLGDRVELDESSTVLRNGESVLGYYSWGSNDPAIKDRNLNQHFVPGALAAMFVSSDARTFKEPPATWTLGEMNNPQTYYAGTPQSLTGDLIRAGVTGTAGHVAEPFLDATIRPDILFPAYVTGANLAEAFYQAMPYLSWQTIVIGDPLCAPFRTRVVATEEIDRGMDSATELPVVFAARLMKIAESRGVKRDAVSAFVRYESRTARGNAAGARQALEEAGAADPRFTSAHILLGMVYQQEGAIDRAIEEYRGILAFAPNQATALNNLAYMLAVNRRAPQEALPLAERAVAITKGDPMILDTLGWIQHLLGKDDDAVKSLGIAVGVAPNIVDVRWHAAVVFASLQDMAKATSELNAALKLDPKLADREEDVRNLQERLNPRRPVR